MKEIERILVVSRSTKYSQKAVHYGVLLAKSLGAEVFIIHSIHNPFGLEGWNLPVAFVPELEREYKKLLETSRSDLEKMIGEEKATGLPIEIIISEGEPNQDIFKTVKEKKIDLLILRSHKEGKLEHIFFGRDIDEIVRKLPCSVMLIDDEPGPYQRLM
ncbi:MAG TPA: universal stress protein [Thermodesulfobacteriota bacterium]|nr:universal stress protein [Thermodesulfobacteriota bacterium]